jgi:predicted GNAT superfamily acetyltransferase
MLRDDLNIVTAAVRALATRPRGKTYMDSVDLAAYKADGQLTGAVFGIPLYRKASLADGKYQYYNEAGTLLASN